MNHCLIDWVRRFIWENASGQTGDDLFDLELVRQTQNVVIDRHVDAEKFKIGSHIAVKPTDFGCQMNHVCRLVLFKDLNHIHVNLDNVKFNSEHLF